MLSSLLLTQCIAKDEQIQRLHNQIQEHKDALNSREQAAQKSSIDLTNAKEEQRLAIDDVCQYMQSYINQNPKL